MKAVVQHFEPANWKELGVLTDTLDEVTNHDRLLRSFRFGDPDYDEHVFTFLRMMIGENGENSDVVRKYIARECPEIGENISSEEGSGRRIVFSPNIFSVPSEGVDSNLVAVMMPFDAGMIPVYEVIKSAASGANMKCKRADDIWEHSTVMQDVFSLIFKAHIVVCDFTGKNPNVFYEAGIAHALGKHVIPITQSAQDVPFDLRHHRFAKYLNNAEGRNDLRDELLSRFETLSETEDVFW